MSNETTGQFLDLDQIIPPAKTVRINGQDYYISGEMTVKDNLEFLQKMRDFSENDPEAVRQMIEQLSKFFLPYDATMTAEKISEMVTVSQLPDLISFIFSKTVEVPEDEDKKKESTTLETIE